ncbi:hypothetical protein BDV09DRAFT_187808 [Aspergillus tetrazonus]
MRCRHQGCIDRVLNARSIMSNGIPDMAGHYETPYCIWHPDVASEETNRQLAARYPEMRYQVGRACAVANYVGLYKELDLLPDVHIAEEARDNNAMEIYNLIMASEVKYDVDDYTRTINLEYPKAGVYLNGDTADILTLMAAYYGDIDRYVRLQRPVLIPRETACIIRGIFHNTLFAKWWSLQGLSISRYDRLTRRRIDRAITACFIVNNDLSQTLRRPDTEPDCIWYPARARSETYRELARRVPSMTATIAPACIVWSTMTLQPTISAISVPTSRNGIYNSTGCEASYVELFVCAPEEWRLKDEDRHLEDLYQEGNII